MLLPLRLPRLFCFGCGAALPLIILVETEHFCRKTPAPVDFAQSKGLPCTLALRRQNFLSPLNLNLRQTLCWSRSMKKQNTSVGPLLSGRDTLLPMTLGPDSRNFNVNWSQLKHNNRLHRLDVPKSQMMILSDLGNTPCKKMFTFGHCHGSHFFQFFQILQILKCLKTI